mmetsp:Transcript_36597/g.146269  ORF Transcript_36597/g.146269 Transcript_36597/m.146269 type:complete len:83 (-) Transcript_36597:1744-1992(-)
MAQGDSFLLKGSDNRFHLAQTSPWLFVLASGADGLTTIVQIRTRNALDSLRALLAESKSNSSTPGVNRALLKTASLQSLAMP